MCCLLSSTSDSESDLLAIGEWLHDAHEARHIVGVSRTKDACGLEVAFGGGAVGVVVDLVGWLAWGDDAFFGEYCLEG